MRILYHIGAGLSSAMERIILNSCWLMAFMYIGLVFAQFCYLIKFLLALGNLMHHFIRLDAEAFMVAVLGLLDITMVANLIYMVTAGGYSQFIREVHFRNLKRKPKVLNNINSGTLKIKMGLSIVGVTMVHLVKDFFNVVSHDEEMGHVVNWDTLMKRIVIHVVFIISTVAMVYVESKLHPPGHHDHDNHEGEHHDEPHGNGRIEHQPQEAH